MSVLIKANNRKTLPLRFEVKGCGYSSVVGHLLRTCEGPGFHHQYQPPASPQNRFEVKTIYVDCNVAWVSLLKSFGGILF